MKVKILVIIGFVLCFGAGVVCQKNDFWGVFNTIKCVDGTRPDENGCCGEEVYRYVQGAEMICPPDGKCCCPVDGECFPPLK